MVKAYLLDKPYKKFRFQDENLPINKDNPLKTNIKTNLDDIT